MSDDANPEHSRLTGVIVSHQVHVRIIFIVVALTIIFVLIDFWRGLAIPYLLLFATPAVMAAVFLSVRANRRLNLLGHAIDLAAAGDLDQSLAISGNDEVATTWCLMLPG